MGAIASSLRRDDELNAVAPVMHLHGDDDAENCTEFDVSLRDEAIEWDEFMDDYLHSVRWDWSHSAVGIKVRFDVP